MQNHSLSIEGGEHTLTTGTSIFIRLFAYQ